MKSVADEMLNDLGYKINIRHFETGEPIYIYEKRTKVGITTIMMFFTRNHTFKTFSIDNGKRFAPVMEAGEIRAMCLKFIELGYIQKMGEY